MIRVDIFKHFIDEIRVIVRQEIHLALEELFKKHTQDRWMNKKELAEYWGVSESYINKKLNEIPHSMHGPVGFIASEVDAWRKGELNKEDQVMSKGTVNISNYKSNNFKVGRK